MSRQDEEEFGTTEVVEPLQFTKEFVDRWLAHLAEREAQNYRSTRRWVAQPNRAGMKGELAVAMWGGGEPDLRNRPGGDRNIDIEFLFAVDGALRWIEIDSKASAWPRDLLVPPRLLAPHRIYILCGPDTRLYTDTGFLPYVPRIGHLYVPIGWQWGHEIAKCPILQLWGEPAHARWKGLLRPMEQLLGAYRWQWRHHGLEARRAYRPPATVNTFLGVCHQCDAPGVFVQPGGTEVIWSCNAHRVW